MVASPHAFLSQPGPKHHARPQQPRPIPHCQTRPNRRGPSNPEPPDLCELYDTWCVPGECVTGGLCNPATGACAPAPPKADGTPCSGGACQGGVCKGGSAPARSIHGLLCCNGRCDVITCQGSGSATLTPNPRTPRRQVRRRHLPPARGMRERQWHVQPRHRGVRRATQARRHGLQLRLLPGRRVHSRWGGGRRATAPPPGACHACGPRSGPATTRGASRQPLPPIPTTAARAATTADRAGPRRSRPPKPPPPPPPPPPPIRKQSRTAAGACVLLLGPRLLGMTLTVAPPLRPR
jgi:hypothetical protein